MAADLLVARIVHILSAAVWVGGTVFLVAVAVPFARTFPPEERTRVAAAIGRRFRPVAWGALIGLVASGVYTMYDYGLLSWTALRASDYGNTLLVKVSGAALMLVLALVHDFVLGPRLERTGHGRGTLLALARANGVLTVLVLVLGVVLAH
jgi:copper resistance protein D